MRDRTCDTCLHQGKDTCRSDTLCDKYMPDEAYIDGRRDGVNLAICSIRNGTWDDRRTAEQILKTLTEIWEAE